MANKLFKDPFTLRKFTGDAFDDVTGLAKAQTPSDTKKKGLIVPISGRERLQMPEGDRKRDIRDIFHECPIATTDNVLIGTDVFEVEFSEPWNKVGCVDAFFKTRVVKKDVG